MRITNAEIKDVMVGLDDRDRLAVMFKLKGPEGTCNWSFLMANSTDVERLELLMEYVGARKVSDLEKKIVRKAVNYSLQAIGHPIEDKFIPVLSEDLEEITEEILKGSVEG